MYVTDGWGRVYAIDVSAGTKGAVRWRFDPQIDRAWAGDVACCGINNRGVALWKDKIISIALDGRMFAINKATGEKVWERKIADPAVAETITLAPLVIRDIAIVGAAGGEYGIRGYIDATDLNTGQPLWRTYTIPGAGEPGNETWKDGRERWKHGGGSVWETATYDAESDTIYQGVGNAGPDYDVEYRPGDNKWASSVLALSPSDGKIKWASSIRPTILTTSTRSPSIRSSTARSTGKIASWSCTRPATASTTHSIAPTARSCSASNMSTSRPGPPARSEDRQAAQLRSQQGCAGLHARQPWAARPGRIEDLHLACRWQELAAASYNPELNLLYLPTIEGCDSITTIEQNTSRTRAAR